MTENVTLPRRLVDQVMDALEDSRVDYDYHGNPFDVRDVKVVEATKALRNALEQPQAELEPVATVSTVIYGPQTAIDIDWNDRLADWPTCLQAHILYTPQGWKLVPSTLTDAQRQAAQDAWWNACNAEMYWDRIYAAMLDAAPQPPVVLEPQVNQDPVAFIRNRIADDFSVRLNRVVTAEDFAGDQAQFLAWCSAHADSDWKPLYSHTQPKREPLTAEQIADIEDMFSNEFGLEAKHSIDFARAIERAVWEKSNG